MNVLDLTDSKVANAWGYNGGPISSATQAIGAEARLQGFDVIRFYSERAPGAVNYAILDNYDKILEPVMVTPVKP